MSYGKSQSNNSNNHHNSINIPNTPKTTRANPSSVDKELTLPPIVESHVLTKIPSNRSFKKSNSINRLDQEFALNDISNNNTNNTINNNNTNSANHKTNNNHWTLSSNASDNDFDMINHHGNASSSNGGGGGEVVITTVEMVDNNSNYNTPLKKNNTSSTLNSYGKSSSIQSRLTATTQSSNKNTNINNLNTTANSHFPLTVSSNSSAISKANSILKLNDDHKDNIQLSILASEANYLESLERLYTLNGDPEQAQQNFNKLEELKFKTNLISKDLNIHNNLFNANNTSNNVNNNTLINPNSNLIVNSVLNQTNTANIMSKIESSKNNDKTLSLDLNKTVTFNNTNNNENTINVNNNSSLITSNNANKNKSSSNTLTTVVPMTNRSNNNLARESTHLGNTNFFSSNNKPNISRQHTIIGNNNNNSTSNNDIRKNTQQQLNKPVIKPRQQSQTQQHQSQQQQQQQQIQKMDNTKRSNSFIRQNTFTNANSNSENALASNNNKNNLKENNKNNTDINKNKFVLNSNRSNDGPRPKTTIAIKNNFTNQKSNETGSKPNPVLVENETEENNDQEKDDYIGNEENEVKTTKLILPQDQEEIINPDNNLSEYTINRILNWLKDIEKCSSMVKPPSQLTWTNRPDGRTNMQNAGNNRKLSNEYCLSEFDSIDDQIIEYNRIVDKTFHIVHFDD